MSGRLGPISARLDGRALGTPCVGPVQMTPTDRLEHLVDATPPDRDRVVDAMRALSIGVVVVWHWSLSITHRDEAGVLVNPNPLDEIPGAWAATWLLQVLPVFFMVGGYANLAAWTSMSREAAPAHRRAMGFLARRARRLLAPVLAFIAVWTVIELIGRWRQDDHRSVLDTYAIVFNPLWFVGAYLLVVLLVPLTATAHRRSPVRALAGLAAAVAIVEVVRFGAGVEGIGWVNLVLVWALVHQFGYLWFDGWFGGDRRRAGAVTVVALAGLLVLTALPIYPRSLVATPETGISHLSPPTMVIAVAALLQLGVVLLLRPWLERRLRRRRVWTTVVGVNAVIMTIFVWHMTALLLSILAFEATGGTLGAEATTSWWLTRPLWILGPGLVLAPLVALFAVLEVGRDRRSSTS